MVTHLASTVHVVIHMKILNTFFFLLEIMLHTVHNFTIPVSVEILLHGSNGLCCVWAFALQIGNN